MTRLPNWDARRHGLALGVIAFAWICSRWLAEPTRTRMILLCGMLALSALFWLATVRPRLAVGLLFAYMSIDGLLRLYFQYHWFIHLAIDLVVLTLSVAMVSRWLSSPQRKVEWSAAHTPVVVYAALCVAQVFNPHINPLLGLGGLKLHIEVMPLFFMGFALARTHEQRVRFCRLFVGIAVWVCGIAVIQYLTGVERWAALGPAFAAKMRQETWWTDAGVTYMRPLSTTLSGSWPGVYAMVAIPLAVALAMLKRNWVQRWLPGLAIAVCACSLVLSAFRGGWVSLLVALAALFVLRPTRAGLTATGFLGAGVAATFLLTGGGIADRFTTLDRPIATFMEERGFYITEVMPNAIRWAPLGFGIGVTTPAVHYFESFTHERVTSLESHNYYVALVIELSLVGLAVMLWIMGTLALRGYRALRLLPEGEEKWLLAGMLCSLLGMAVSGLVGPVLLGAFPGAYFWFITGMVSRVFTDAEQADGNAETVPAEANNPTWRALGE